MTRILGKIPGELARILDLEGGSVRSIPELQDQDGVSLVYDIGQLTDWDLVVMTARTFDTGNMAQSTTVTSAITGLPRGCSILGFNAATDDPTRIAQAMLYLDNIGTVAGGVESHQLWTWVTGDPFVTQPTSFTAGGQVTATLGNLLVADLDKRFFDIGPILFLDKNFTETRQGVDRVVIETTATAFGAGTVRVAGNIIIAFRVALGGRAIMCRPPGIP